MVARKSLEISLFSRHEQNYPSGLYVCDMFLHTLCFIQFRNFLFHDSIIDHLSGNCGFVAFLSIHRWNVILVVKLSLNAEIPWLTNYFRMHYYVLFICSFTASWILQLVTIFLIFWIVSKMIHIPCMIRCKNKWFVGMQMRDKFNTMQGQIHYFIQAT